MRLTRITASPQTFHDKSSIAATTYLDESVAGVVVDFYISAPLPSFGADAVKVGTCTTDASGVAHTDFVMDKSLFSSVFAKAKSIGADLPFSMGLAGSAKSVSLVAKCPSCVAGVSCALLYDEAGALPEGGSVAGSGGVAVDSTGQVVLEPSPVASAPAGVVGTGSTANTGKFNYNRILLLMIAVVVVVLIWRKYRDV